MNFTLTKNIFISWHKKHNFIAQHRTKTIWPTGATKCNSTATCLPNAFISSMSSNIFSLNIHYIANRMNLSFNGHSWTRACRPLHLEMNEHWCATLTTQDNRWILSFQTFPGFYSNCKHVFRRCSLLAVLPHKTVQCWMKQEVCCSEETSSPSLSDWDQ